ncbi:hypothetical protein ILYODFUR_035160 [Ilyodon furcidens]|uniref:Ig-like domain-containing protein n=1 Tax=Ilyodon furcidens TaxID=33524 RepID=A0ABV0SUU7_9TELE
MLSVKLSVGGATQSSCQSELGADEAPSLVAVAPSSSQFISTADMSSLFISVLLAAVGLECRAQTDSVLQPDGDVTAAEGDTGTLACLYNTSSSNHYLYWYKQEGSSSPQFILSRFKVGEGKTVEKERFSSSLDSAVRSVPLRIQPLHLSDSAVYYCALQPTVTGNTTTLYNNLVYPPTSTRGPHTLLHLHGLLGFSLILSEKDIFVCSSSLNC